MELSFDAIQTLAVAIAVLFVGSALLRRVGFLQESNIPVPVVGGVVFAVVHMGLHMSLGVDLSFDGALRGPLMLAFFTTIGLGADLRELGRGGVQLAILAVVCFVYLIVQNTIGVTAAMGMDLHPAIGLLGSSITLSGGHGTGAAYAEDFAGVRNIAGAMELAMATATFGLVIGGVVGGPVAGRLIRRQKLIATSDDPGVATEDGEKVGGPILGPTLLRALFVILLCLIGGQIIAAALSGATFTLPPFVWCLLIGVAIRNAAHFFPKITLHTETVEVLGSLSLGLFLAMALMDLRLWQLAGFAGPLAVLLVLQTIGMVAFASIVTFRAMGARYDAAVIASGHCGFGMGSTPTAMANMEAVTQRYGHSARAFLVVPLMGAFFIDLLNALVIQGFLALPVFGP